MLVYYPIACRIAGKNKKRRWLGGALSTNSEILDYRFFRARVKPINAVPINANVAGSGTSL
jgi:hypothetical protein